MMDFSWSELLVIVIVAIFAVGPKQLPEVLYKAGRLVRRLQYIRYNISQQMEDYLHAGDLKDLRDTAPIHPSKTTITPYGPDTDIEREEDSGIIDITDQPALAPPVKDDTKPSSND
jgi:Tat protein translocase TatB subunit